jgi:hypothetical protein
LTRWPFRFRLAQILDPNTGEQVNMKVRLIAFLAAFGLMIVAAIIGNVLESKGLLTREKLGPDGVAAGMMIYFGLFCLICFTIVPLAVRIFLIGQTKIGNGQLAIIKWLQAHENAVVFAAWGFFILSLIIIYALAKDQIIKDLM